MRLLTKATSLLVLIGAACGLLLASSASASPESSTRAEIRPPAGIPDLSTMAIRIDDLAPGAKIRRQGYVRPGRGFVATYVREFRAGTARLRNKRFLFLESDLELLQNAADARQFYKFVLRFSSAVDPDDLAGDFRAETGLNPRYVRVGAPTKLRTGDESFSMTVRYGTRVGEFRSVIAALRVDRVVALLGFSGGPKARVGRAEARQFGLNVNRRVRQGLLPVNRDLPSISGTPAVGQTLTTTTGTWINQPTGYTYRWRRCDTATTNCMAIAGATARTYVLTAADTGSTIMVAVRATNGRGSTTAISWATTAVQGPPINTVLPTIFGEATVGQTLTANPGMWSGGLTGLAYAWRRCDTAGANCVDIVGATSQTYVLVAADVASTIRVAVTASNEHGPTTAVSAQTLVIFP